MVATEREIGIVEWIGSERWAPQFQHQRDSSQKRDQQRMAALEQKLRTKNEVLSELMEEHVALKKSLGET